MKVLIADDLQPKISRLVDLLTVELQIPRSDVLIAQTAIDARRVLKDTKVDLFILDVVLPLRAEDQPTTEASINLLEELAEEGLYPTVLYPRTDGLSGGGREGRSAFS